jgi:hypothetical protein
MVYNGHIFSVATFDLTTIRTKFNPNQRCSIKMHVKEIYVIFIHLFDSGRLLIIDLNKKKGKKGRG